MNRWKGALVILCSLALGLAVAFAYAAGALVLGLSLPVAAYLVFTPMLLIVVTVVFPTYLAVATVRQAVVKRQLRLVTEARPIPLSRPRAVPHIPESAALVVARVLEVQGMCPARHHFDVGDEYFFTNAHASPTLCKLAERSLQRYVAGLRTGAVAPGEQWVCQGPRHRIVFGVYPERKAVA